MTGPPIADSALKGRLTPEAEALLAQLRANGFKDWSRMGLDGARSLIEVLVALTGGAEPVSRVEDIVITSAGRPDILGRLYIPDGPALLPLLIYMHGGGGRSEITH